MYSLVFDRKVIYILTLLKKLLLVWYNCNFGVEI